MVAFYTEQEDSRMTQQASGVPAARDLPTTPTIILNMAKLREDIVVAMNHRQLDQRGLAWEAGVQQPELSRFLTGPPAGKPDRPPPARVLFPLLRWLHPDRLDRYAIHRRTAGHDPVAA